MTLKVGVIGCGAVGLNTHTRLLKENAHTNVTCICDSNAGRAKKAASQYGIPRSYVKSDRLIENEDLDLIHICTPPASHLEIGVKALEAGCHVLIEKPFTLKLSEADTLIQKAKSAGRSLSAVHNLLFTPTMATTFQKQRELGAINFINMLWGRKSGFTKPWIKGLPGGRLGENLPHPLYCMLPFIEKPSVTDVQALKLRSDSEEPFDELHVSIKGRRTLASLSLTNNSQRPNTLILSGTKGSLMTRFSQFQKMSILWSKDGASPTRGSGHAELINKWIDSLITGSDPPVTPFQAREVVRIYESIWDRCLK